MSPNQNLFEPIFRNHYLREEVFFFAPDSFFLSKDQNQFFGIILFSELFGDVL
jgi:hypothetical protein